MSAISEPVPLSTVIEPLLHVFGQGKKYFIPVNSPPGIEAGRITRSTEADAGDSKNNFVIVWRKEAEPNQVFVLPVYSNDYPQRRVTRANLSCTMVQNRPDWLTI